jgi:hypothetical protein
VVSHSRKEGWVIIPKHEDEQWGAIKRVEAMEQEIDRIGNYSCSEFEDLVGLCSPRERHLLRYLLAKILGSKVAATRFGI